MEGAKPLPLIGPRWNILCSRGLEPESSCSEGRDWDPSEIDLPEQVFSLLKENFGQFQLNWIVL